MNAKKKAMGRGLEALLKDPATDITSKGFSGQYGVGSIASIDVDRIDANPFQPRDQFEMDSLNELAESIRTQGIIQPITVRKLGYDKYQLISGERRLRAAKIAGLDEIPAYIRVANDQQMLELSLVENIQREDLNPIEIAITYQRLIDECGITQEKLSDRVGKNRVTVTNYIRLLKLPPDIQLALREDKLSMGHARALINIEDPATQITVLNDIIEKELSVRAVEAVVRKLARVPSAKTRNVLPEKYRNARTLLTKQLKSKIEIKRNTKGKGSVVINFVSDKQLDHLISLLQDKNDK